jgi:hypothetical protein
MHRLRANYALQATGPRKSLATRAVKTCGENVRQSVGCLDPAHVLSPGRYDHEVACPDGLGYGLAMRKTLRLRNTPLRGWSRCERLQSDSLYKAGSFFMALSRSVAMSSAMVSS